jgi:hypothetical protein
MMIFYQKPATSLISVKHLIKFLYQKSVRKHFNNEFFLSKPLLKLLLLVKFHQTLLNTLSRQNLVHPNPRSLHPVITPRFLLYNFNIVRSCYQEMGKCFSNESTGGMQAVCSRGITRESGGAVDIVNLFLKFRGTSFPRIEV